MSVFLLDSDTESASPRAPEKAQGSWLLSGVQSPHSAASREAPVLPEHRGGAGRGGAARLLRPPTLRPLHFQTWDSRERVAPSLGWSREEQTGFREASPLRARRRLYCQDRKLQPQLASALPGHSCSAREAGKGTQEVGRHPSCPRGRAPARGATGQAPWVSVMPRATSG